MIIFLYGPDDYRRGQRKKFYIDEFKNKYSGLSAGYFDLAEESAPDRLEEFLRGQSLFEKKKLAVLSNVFMPEASRVARILKSVSASDGEVVILSEAKSAAAEFGFLSRLKEPSLTEKFPHLDGAEWLSFVGRSAKYIGVGLDAEAVKFLAAIYKGNSWGLITELEKLDNLDKKNIKKSDLEDLGFETLPDYWSVINSFRGRNMRDRLWSLEHTFAQNEPHQKIFNILSSVWREKTPQMAEYDFKIKSGKFGYEEALLDLVIR